MLLFETGLSVSWRSRKFLVNSIIRSGPLRNCSEIGPRVACFLQPIALLYRPITSVRSTRPDVEKTSVADADRPNVRRRTRWAKYWRWAVWVIEQTRRGWCPAARRCLRRFRNFSRRIPSYAHWLAVFSFKNRAVIKGGTNWAVAQEPPQLGGLHKNS